MIDIITGIIVFFILGVYGASVYTFFKEKKEKDAKRKCQMDKFNR
tara:strand:- start:335 stop:469 length:135 start_codon:yes stop_codon:yes gene_type:complete